MVLTIYLVGLLILLFRAALGWMFAWRLEQAANTIQDSNALERLRHHGRTFGLKRLPRLAEAGPLSVPLTLSVLRPVILLPANWRQWGEAKLDAVLAHELAHVSRGDALTQRLSLLHRAAFWFSPLSWWLHRCIADLAEQASDEAALHAGADRADYARTLLDFFAEASSRRRVRWQAVSMARDAGVAHRIERILTWKYGVSPRLTGAFVIGMVSVTAPVVLLIASVRPAVGLPRTFTSHLTQTAPAILSAVDATPSALPTRLPSTAQADNIIFDASGDSASTALHYSPNYQPTQVSQPALPSASAGQTTTGMTYDSYMRQVQGVVPDKQNYVALDEEIWLRAQRSLGDLRLFAGDQEVQYALITQRGSESAQRVEARLLGLGRVDGETQFMIDMTGIPEYDEVALRLAGTATDFVVRAHVEGLDSLEQSTGVDLGNSVLFDFSQENLGSDFTLKFRPATFRFLRVRLPEVAPEQVQRTIAVNTRIYNSVWSPDSAELPITQEGHTTVVTWEASEQVPVDRVVFDIDPSQVNFWRGIQVLNPTGGTITNTGIHRVRMVRGGNLVENESISIDLPNEAWGPFRMVIENGDDPPLKITAAKAYAFERRLYFNPNGSAALTLYYGNQRLAAPRYAYSKNFHADGDVAVASLGIEMRNPAWVSSNNNRTIEPTRPPKTAGPSDGCSARMASLRPSDPVYADAMDLARALTDRGFVVNCILASLHQDVLEGQKGAAFYRTNHGDFEVWFLPKPQSFAPLEVIEQRENGRENGRYLYSFRGFGERSPDMVSPAPMDFIKYGNQLFVVWGNEQLALRLRNAFDSH